MNPSTGKDQASKLDVWVSILVFAGVLLWLGMVYKDFSAENQQFAKGVCCGFTDPVFDATIKLESGQAVDYSKGYAAYLGALWWEWFKRESNALLWMSHGAHILTGFLAFVFGMVRGRPLVGGLSAVAILLAPINLYTSLRWDVYALQGPILMLSWMCIYWSRVFTKLLPTLGFVGLVWVSAFWSFRETDNLILLLSHAALAFGAWICGLIARCDEDGQEISRLWSMLIAILACAYILWQITSYWRFSSPEGLQYYFREAEDPMMVSRIELTQSLRWFGYWGHLYWRAFGPALANLFWVALGFSVVCRRTSWGLFAGVVIPYVALSWISKRNFYYPSPLWILVPLFIGEGISGVAKHWLRRCLCTMGVVLCVWNAQQRLNGVDLIGDDQYGGLFQTSDNDLILKPVRLYGVDALATAIRAQLPEDSCTEERIVLLEANAMTDEVAIRFGQSHPCTLFKRQLQRFGANVRELSIRVWVRDPNHSDISESWLEEKGFVKGEDVLMENRFRLDIWTKVSE